MGARAVVVANFQVIGRLTLVAALLTLWCGCGRVPEGHRVVTGVVIMADGEPLAGLEGSAVVRFDPADPLLREERESIGLIEDDGSFEVMTFAGGDGVPLGDYKVVLTMEKYPDNYKIVPDPYTHYETTPWTVTVTEDGKNHFVLEISLDVGEKADGTQAK